MIKQIYHHYELWEDFKNGMWVRSVPENEENYLLEKAITFTGDHLLYGSWMLKVIDQWPIACEQNLTNATINRRAWIGQAAVSLAIKCPEYITRLAWWNLSESQQTLANRQADNAIEKWERQYLESLIKVKQSVLF